MAIFFAVLFLWGPLISKYIISHMHNFFLLYYIFLWVFIYFFSFCQLYFNLGAFCLANNDLERMSEDKVIFLTI